MVKTLFVSDLDGTLLRSDATISSYTADVINELTQRGILFSYATARSFVTARKITEGLNAKIPVIVYNGAFIIDNATGEILLSNYFTDEIRGVIKDLLAHDISLLVYAYIDDTERFSFLPASVSSGMRAFLDSRKGDPRWREVSSAAELLQGDIFYITCVDSKEKLEPLYEKYRETYRTLFQVEIYTKEYFLELMPRSVSKANAICQMKERLGCARVVSFGDAMNDLDMFGISDEAYAVENACDELKHAATDVIGSNDDDGVAHWLKGRLN